MAEVDRTRYLLSDADNEEIFRAAIVPREYGGRPAQATPVVVFVAGQTGAGKTNTSLMARRALDQRGGAISIDLDVLKPYHPRYPALMAADDTTAGAYTSIDGRRWMEKAQEWAINERVDVIMESAMRLPDEFEQPARRFAAGGYRVEVLFLAVPAAWSRLGVLDRYWQQVATHGHGRPIDPAVHDASYAGIQREAQAIDAGTVPVDVTSVVLRGNAVIYHNSRQPDGSWREPPRAAEVVHTERTRLWTPQETARFTTAARQLHAHARTQDEREAVGAVVDLARPHLAHPWTSSTAPTADLLAEPGQTGRRLAEIRDRLASSPPPAQPVPNPDPLQSRPAHPDPAPDTGPDHNPEFGPR
ncbi:Zeta toxin [Frankia canadensis]|uniref:UDP-N-acetylglucosamine kinase n=1 Tax=Frankia canadensis TaxID=1836972 RepID=A0A2I2KQW2_9ACTN|nr:zeta toxin family protein [Frankia canadensis]SNQ48026.1 Zeta toxin [Frankia canadensis]SOU55316.1 Zeta toxin [Frankia canadensis]